MTNKEAIASLKALCHTCESFPKCVNDKPECFQAIEMAINALKEIDKYHAWIDADENNAISELVHRYGADMVVKVCEDALNPEDAEKFWSEQFQDEDATCCNLPSAQPEAENTIDYLEYAYSGAKMNDDLEEQTRLSRAIWAYKQDVYSDLASTQAERKNEKWEYVMDGNASRRKCSSCGAMFINNGDKFYFCPNCNTDIRGEQDG